MVTSWAPVIKFVGLFDTVQMTLDLDDLDISHADPIKVVRHAMALNEDKPTRPLLLYDTTVLPDSDVVQAWFVGKHADIGGGAEHDGLSLYSLQWMLNESQKHGLVLGHNPEGTQEGLIENPLHLVFPPTAPPSSEPTTSESGHEQQAGTWVFEYSNGLEILMQDLRRTHNHGNIQDIPRTKLQKKNAHGTKRRPGHFACLKGSAPPGTAPRAVFDGQELKGYGDKGNDGLPILSRTC